MKLFLSKKDQYIGGVCGGLGDYFGIPSLVFRILFFISFSFLGIVSIIIYVGIWFFAPYKEKNSIKNDSDSFSIRTQEKKSKSNNKKLNFKSEELRTIYNEIVKNKGYLIHVTEYDNLESIIKNGLLSRKKIEKNNINPQFMTDRLSFNLDTKKKTINYVKLAFDETYNMFSAKIYKRNLFLPVIIKVNPEIIIKQTCKFSNKNSAKSNSQIGKAKEIIDLLDFNIIYHKVETLSEKKKWHNEWKDSKQAEVLVKEKILCNDFKQVVIPKEKRLELSNLKNLNSELIYKIDDTKKELNIN